MSFQGRRRRKQPEFEPDPVITVPDVKVDDVEVVRTEVTQTNVVPDKKEELKVIEAGKVDSKGHEVYIDRMANRHKDLPIVTIPDKDVATSQRNDPVPLIVSQPLVTNQTKPIRDKEKKE